MKKQFLPAIAIVSIAFTSCSDIKYKEPLPHGAAEVTILPDEMLGKFEIKNDEIPRTMLWFVQTEKNTWTMMEQEFMREDDLKAEQFKVQNDSLLTFDDGKWVFRSRFKKQQERYLLDNLKVSYSFDLRNHKFRLFDSTDEPNALEVRQKDGAYYFNIKDNGISLYAAHPTKEGMRLCYLSDLKVDAPKLPFPVQQVIKTIGEGTPDTSYLANPTNTELQKMMRDTALYEFFDLIRVEETN